MIRTILDLTDNHKVSVYMAYSGEFVTDGTLQLSPRKHGIMVNNYWIFIDDIASVKFLDSGMIQVSVYAWSN